MLAPVQNLHRKGEKRKKETFKAAYSCSVTFSSKFMNCFRPWVSLNINTSFHLQNHTTGPSSSPKWNVFHGLNSVLWELLYHIPKSLQITFQFSMTGGSLRRGPVLLFKTILLLMPKKDSFHRSSFGSLVASLKAYTEVICTIPSCN